MSEAIVLLVKFQAKAGAAERVRSAMSGMFTPTRAEAGCMAYEAFVASDDPSIVQLFEVWDSRASLQKHFETPYFREFAAKLEELLERPYEVQEFQRLG